VINIRGEKYVFRPGTSSPQKDICDDFMAALSRNKIEKSFPIVYKDEMRSLERRTLGMSLEAYYNTTLGVSNKLRHGCSHFTNRNC
jgi:hypothetical protein